MEQGLLIEICLNELHTSDHFFAVQVKISSNVIYVLQVFYLCLLLFSEDEIVSIDWWLI